jgi:membrane-bound lytic murein transglycosylase D
MALCMNTFIMKINAGARTRAAQLLLLCAILIGCQTSTELKPGPAQSNRTQQAELTEGVRLERPHANTSALVPRETSETPAGYSSLWERMRASLQLSPYYSHSAVLEQLPRYSENQRYFDLVKERASPFLFWIVAEIERRGLPMELALLPMVESTFNPTAHSRQNAVGLWQFVAPTASSLGLQQDWWFDGRRDPRASTVAALDYLEVLNDQFDGDWLITLAAYNTGGGNVRRAFRRRGAEIDELDFWELPLAPETRSHVPRVLALAQIVLNPQDHGIELAKIANEEPLALVDVGSQIDLAQVAAMLDVDLETIRSLNPGYLQWATHPEQPQIVAVPKQMKNQFQNSLASLDRSRYVSWEHYRIRPGDTLGGIASRLGTTVETLRVINQIRGSRIIAGRPLLIPRGSGLSEADLASLQPPLPETRLAVAVPPRYVVRRGDNLWSIARRFDLRSSDIAAYNQLDRDALLQPGQALDFGFMETSTLAADFLANRSGSKIYRVRRGDTMAGIAERYSANLADLLRWNDLGRNDLIFPGQQIQVIAP